MFDTIKCPYCQSSDWECVDVETDYPNKTTIQLKHICYCESCERGFDFTIESEVKKISITPDEKEVSAS